MLRLEAITSKLEVCDHVNGTVTLTPALLCLSLKTSIWLTSDDTLNAIFTLALGLSPLVSLHFAPF